jgi:hypothetical protein
MNENIDIIKNFIHRKGQHCESSSMRDIFEFYGFPMSEPLAFGLDATMGFTFIDYSNTTDFDSGLGIPFFLGGKQDTITEKSLACRILGLNITKETFSNGNSAWKRSKELMDNNIPMIIIVDMYYLAWMETNGEKFHFGMHAVTLAGYNEDLEIAFIGESDLKGFQEISIADLKNARNSKFGLNFMRPKNAHFYMNKKDKRPPLSAGFKLSIQKVVNHMLRPSMNYNGKAALKVLAESIPNWDKKLDIKVENPMTKKNQSLANLTFSHLYGLIEEYGTGGACFRNLYQKFCQELVDHPEIKEGSMGWNTKEIAILQDSIPLISQSAQKWTDFAEQLESAVKKGKNDCLSCVDLGYLSEIIHNIYDLEEEFFMNLSKIKN